MVCGGVFWNGAFVTLPMVTLLLLDQGDAPASAYRGYTAGKPLFHPSAPDRNISPSGKNRFISPLLCPSWKMKNRLLTCGIKRKGTWLKDLLKNRCVSISRCLDGFGFSCEALFKDTRQMCAGSILSCDLGRSGRPLYQSQVQPRTGGNDATNNIITALVHISLIWQKPSLNSVPLTWSDAPLLALLLCKPMSPPPPGSTHSLCYHHHIFCF